MIPLPIDEALPQVAAALRAGPACVLTAPPGSGKSTRVPPLTVGLLPGQVYLLQPRRIAAKSLARRISQEQGWQLGAEVGYRVRFDSVGGRDTRLWVMTEGSLTRQFTADPYLEGISAVILDEFHERSLHTDLAISYLRELQRTVREDLKLIVMSATIDAKSVSDFLGGCPIVEAPGRTYPVTVSNRQELPDVRLAEAVTRAVADAVRDPDCGDILVFLPGMGEIRACERALQETGLDDGRLLCPLHGSLPPDVQDRALSPAAMPKIVLATNVAETSVTIPGVRTVIDTGTARVMRHNPATGLDELRLEPVSRFSLEQRAGRAGRTAPGRCFRLSTPLTDARRPLATDPELARVDLAGTLLLLKRMEYPDPRRFPWFEAPSTVRLEAAEELLGMLAATTAPFAGMTPLGERLAELPVHPRIGRLLLDAAAAGEPRLGASLAAVTGERDVRSQQRNGPAAAPAVADALDRLELLTLAEREGFHPGLRQRGIEPQAAREAAQVRDDLLRAGAGSGERGAGNADLPTLVPRLLLAAYPDRVVKRAASDANRGMMVGGVAVELDVSSAVAARSGHARPELFLAVSVQGLGQGLRASTVVRQAAELTEADIEAVFPGSIQRRERLAWDDQRQQVTGQIGWFYRDLAIRMARDTQPDPDAVAAFLAQQLAPVAAAVLAEDEEAAAWLARYRWLRLVAPDQDLPPEPDPASVIAELCRGCRSRAEVVTKPKLDALAAQLTWQQRTLLEDWAPSHHEVPTGSRIRLDYSGATAEQPPVLAVRLQELFGERDTPRLAGGRLGVLLHLLGPNFRCEQITRDLAGFWANTYPQVRKDLRGRYPKHSWPDDPLTALPVAKGRHRG